MVCGLPPIIRENGGMPSGLGSGAVVSPEIESGLPGSLGIVSQGSPGPTGARSIGDT